MTNRSKKVYETIRANNHRIIELIKMQQDISAKRKSLPFMSDKYSDLKKQYEELEQQYKVLTLENDKANEAYLRLRNEGNEQELAELKEKLNEIEKSELFDKPIVKKGIRKILQTPNNYTKEEVEEAQQASEAFFNALCEAGVAIPVEDAGMIA